jgi:thiol-disulfide isomerase/thioredoxin/outer membrane lipoprotein-sorting protein
VARRALLPLACLAVLALTSAAQPPRDGFAILRRVSAVYGKARRFYLAGDIHARLTTAAGTDTSLAWFVAASGGNGRLRDQLDAPGATMARVSNGAKSWIYDGQNHQYVEHQEPIATPDGMDSLQVQQLGGIIGAILNSYRGILDGADSVSVLRSETVRQNGRTSVCDVVRARYSAPAADRVMVRTYWVERERGLVLRQETSLRTQSDDGAAERSETMWFRKTSVDQPIPDSVFAFRPPAGARKVDQLGGEQPPEEDFTGRLAADFALSDLAGNTHRLSEERGKVVMLDFWATWCGPCRMQMPAVDKLYQEFKSKGLVVFAVNQREPAERAQAYIEKNSYTTTTLLDSQGEVGRQYGVRGIPTLVIIGRDGKIVAHWVGVHPETTLREGLKKAGIE